MDTNKFSECLRLAWVKLIVYTGQAKYLGVNKRSSRFSYLALRYLDYYPVLFELSLRTKKRK